jgi:hypothetical protein
METSSTAFGTLFIGEQVLVVRYDIPESGADLTEVAGGFIWLDSPGVPIASNTQFILKTDEGHAIAGRVARVQGDALSVVVEPSKD